MWMTWINFLRGKALPIEIHFQFMGIAHSLLGGFGVQGLLTLPIAACGRKSPLFAAFDVL